MEGDYSLNKAGCNVYMTAGQKLQNVLCSNNKTKPDRMERKGVYKYNCKPCKKSYVGKTARNFKTRHAEHMRAAETSKWSHSGLTQHMEKCQGPIEGPEILCTIDSKNKAALKRELRIKEALYIRRFNCGPYKGMNLDMGSYISTTQWAPVFNGMSRDTAGGGARE